jgi:hypothetical protein
LPAQLAEELASIFIEGIKTRLESANNDVVDRIEAARELATLLMVLGRQTEVIDTGSFRTSGRGL